MAKTGLVLFFVVVFGSQVKELYCFLNTWNKVTDDNAAELVAAEVVRRLKGPLLVLEEKLDNITRILTGSVDIPKGGIYDCFNILKEKRDSKSGVYRITVPHVGKVKVFCNMINNEGWTVISRRINGSVNFNRSWNDYKNGFGNSEGEYWIGNEALFRLTTKKPYKLRIRITKWSGLELFADYNVFRVESELFDYLLHLAEYNASSSAGDSMTALSCSTGLNAGMRFSTYNRDNDFRLNFTCAKELSGGWWFSRCGCSNLNGLYVHGGSVPTHGENIGIYWDTQYRLLGYLKNSLKRAVMEIAPRE